MVDAKVCRFLISGWLLLRWCQNTILWGVFERFWFHSWIHSWIHILLGSFIFGCDMLLHMLSSYDYYCVFFSYEKLSFFFLWYFSCNFFSLLASRIVCDIKILYWRVTHMHVYSLSSRIECTNELLDIWVSESPTRGWLLDIKDTQL